MKHTIVRLIFGGFVLLFGSQKITGQEIIPPGQVIGEFTRMLQENGSNPDTIPIYVNYVKRLIARGNYPQADSLLTIAQPGFEALGDSALLAEIYKERAFMYKVQRRFPKSLEDYLWLKGYYERREDKNALIEIYSLIAEYYRAFRGFDQMDKHLQLAEDLFDEVNPSNANLAYWYSRKAAWSTEALGNSDSVEFYAKEGLRLAIEANDIYTQALTLNELGFLGMNRKDDRQVFLSHFNRAKDLLYEHERYRDYVDVVNNIASYTSFSNPEEALEILEYIIPIEEENGWYIPKIRSLEMIRSLYTYFGRPKDSDIALNQIYLARIDEMSTAHAIAVNDLALSYEKDLAEKELEVQQQKTEAAETEAENNKTAFIIAAIIAGLLLLISILIYQVYLRFRKKNEQLNQQQDQIKKANTELEKSLAHQTTLYKELNHRVKNNLSVLTGLIYLQEVREDSDDFKKILGTLRSRIKSMALVHENLYNSESEDKIDFQVYLRLLFQELEGSLSVQHTLHTHLECPNFKLGLAQAVPLAMIINELFTNSIKHGFKGKEQANIHVKAYFDSQDGIVEYLDDGVGLPADESGKKTLGLRLVQLLIEQLDASFEDHSQASGVHYKLRIPKLVA